jgi:hypothetical protein
MIVIFRMVVQAGVKKCREHTYWDLARLARWCVPTNVVLLIVRGALVLCRRMEERMVL